MNPGRELEDDDDHFALAFQSQRGNLMMAIMFWFL